MSDQSQIRVFSVDDHPLLREGIAAIISNQPSDRTQAVAVAVRRGIIHL